MENNFIFHLVRFSTSVFFCLNFLVEEVGYESSAMSVDIKQYAPIFVRANDVLRRDDIP